ncbi:MAG: cytochrome c peroxidase [Caldilineaceae bacterium]
MKRSIIAFIVMVELIVGGALFYNIRYLYTERTAAPTPNQPVETPIVPAPTPAEITSGVALNSNVPLLDLPAVIFNLFTPLPVEASPGTYIVSDEMVNLGKMLFYDPRLSANQQMSCNTCHPLDRYGTDNLQVPFSHDGTPGQRNAQTVYNAALHISQFWDGRSPNVEEQSKVPIMAAGEMGMLEPGYVESILRSIPGYAPLFTAAFPNNPEPITMDNAAIAIGAFERRLMTPSRFDRFLAGDRSQLTPEEQQGLTTFVNVGCSNCHVGVTVGGLLYKKLGEIVPYDTADLGRFNVTGLDEDKYVFKVPSLRNVARTFPYLHDGSIQTLEEMVTLMGRHQLGKDLTREQVASIVTFLHTLTGEIPLEYINPPQLPESGPNTPGPILKD